MLKVYVIHQWCSTQVTLSIQRNGARRAWTTPHPELKPWHVHACSLVELLGLLVKRRALLDCDKALETQCLPCLGDGSNKRSSCQTPTFSCSRSCRSCSWSRRQLSYHPRFSPWIHGRPIPLPFCPWRSCSRSSSSWPSWPSWRPWPSSPSLPWPL